MSTSSWYPLTPVRVLFGEAEFNTIVNWPFADQPFYHGQIVRLLQSGIPERLQFGKGQAWVYQDPDGNFVGFGILDECQEYPHYAEGKSHTYIPLLAVHPAFQKQGHGRKIVEHLICEARAWAEMHQVSTHLFLDVYIANEPPSSCTRPADSKC